MKGFSIRNCMHKRYRMTRVSLNEMAYDIKFLSRNTSDFDIRYDGNEDGYDYLMVRVKCKKESYLYTLCKDLGFDWSIKKSKGLIK